jgi:uncharacterized protein YbjT (DUF2867 family)
MKVLIFGATGMVGQGVLREALLADDVTQVQTIGRSASGQSQPKLREVVQSDLYDWRAIEPQLQGFDACFFCLGVSSSGMTEADYAHLTYDLTLTLAEALARVNPQMTFIYVSGAGTDASEHGRVMWARVKGRTENALQRLPFKAVYLVRPGVIQPLHGIRSKTPAYRWLYVIMAPLLTPLRHLFPRSILTTESIGEAMLVAARSGAPTAVLETADIHALVQRANMLPP